MRDDKELYIRDNKKWNMELLFSITVTSKLCVTGLCARNSPGTGEFPAQMASDAENVSIWWRHHSLSWGESTANSGFPSQRTSKTESIPCHDFILDTTQYITVIMVCTSHVGGPHNTLIVYIQMTPGSRMPLEESTSIWLIAIKDPITQHKAVL